jgi:hypothetical protein
MNGDLECGTDAPDIVHYRLRSFTGKDPRKMTLKKDTSTLFIGKSAQFRVKDVGITNMGDRKLVCTRHIVACDIE